MGHGARAEARGVCSERHCVKSQNGDILLWSGPQTAPPQLLLNATSKVIDAGQTLSVLTLSNDSAPLTTKEAPCTAGSSASTWMVKELGSGSVAGRMHHTGSNLPMAMGWSEERMKANGSGKGMGWRCLFEGETSSARRQRRNERDGHEKLLHGLHIWVGSPETGRFPCAESVEVSQALATQTKAIERRDSLSKRCARTQYGLWVRATEGRRLPAGVKLGDRWFPPHYVPRWESKLKSWCGSNRCPCSRFGGVELDPDLTFLAIISLQIPRQSVECSPLSERFEFISSIECSKRSGGRGQIALPLILRTRYLHLERSGWAPIRASLLAGLRQIAGCAHLEFINESEPPEIFMDPTTAIGVLPAGSVYRRASIACGSGEAGFAAVYLGLVTPLITVKTASFNGEACLKPGFAMDLDPILRSGVTQEV
ncbi:hypothetical protein FA13DRAFT_1713738 [Coprinellus micaceus]|uniref:Uncharacterized protein n=1 Tax=Coprinellus micaceus TaxID=71717 RepID=A0A4Y7SUX6_COPMI|nr:hypothetical protein FA13DRAFT_1713738 [Coprinellus micaceus]